MDVVWQFTVLCWLTLSSFTLSIPLSLFFNFNMGSSCNYSVGKNVTANDILNDPNCTEIIFPSVINVSIPYDVPLPVMFPFFDTVVSEIHANVNGFLSFDGELLQQFPVQFPTHGDSIVAAFWNNIDITGVNGGNVFMRPSTNLTDLNQADQEIRVSFPDLPNFTAKWMFIVSWQAVAYFHQGEKHNTFQTVLITDGEHSFAINNYEDDGIQWSSVLPNGTGDGLNGTPAQAGYNDGTGLNYFIVPGSNTPDILSIASTSNSNVSVPGKWIFRLTYSSLSVHPPVLLQHVGGEILLNCTPPDNASKIGWLRNGEVISDSDDRISYLPDESFRHVLIIANATSLDEANYTCGLNQSGTLVNLQSSEVVILRDIVNIFKSSGEEQLVPNAVINSIDCCGSGDSDQPEVDLVCLTPIGHENTTWSDLVVNGSVIIANDPGIEYMAGLQVMNISTVNFVVQLTCSSPVSRQSSSVIITSETPYLRLLGDGNITATLGSRPEVEFVLAIDSDGVRDFQNNITNFLLFSFTGHDLTETRLSLRPQMDPNNFQCYKTVLPSVEVTTEGVYTLTYTDFQHGNTSASVNIHLDVPRIKLVPSVVVQRFGSNITLACVPSNETIPVFWTRNGQVIDDALFRPNGMLRHILIIINAQSSDVGNYSCGLNVTGLPTNTQSGEVILFNEISLTRSFSSVTLLEGTSVTLSCTPSLQGVPLFWTHNGVNITQTEGTSLSPDGLDLILVDPTAGDSGDYLCHASSAIAESIAVNVLSTCKADFSGALVWTRSRVGQEVNQKCSELHPSFRSGVDIRRQCGDDGSWSTVDLRDCTMFIGSKPVVVVYFMLSLPNDVNSTNITDNIVSEIQSVVEELDIAESSVIAKANDGAELDSVPISISFSLQSNTVTRNMIGSINNTIQSAVIAALPTGTNLTEQDFTTLAFQPNPSCSCDTDTTMRNGLLTVCTGPSTPPCVCDTAQCVCNTPTFVGDGSVCGVDSDSDGFPDVGLDCAAPSCVADICPEIYSVTNSGEQTGSACDPTIEIFGCNFEQDDIWNIMWPPTEVGQTAIQKCPGGSEAEGLASRRCAGDDDWEEPDVSECRSVEQIRLEAQARVVERIVSNLLSADSRDLTISFNPDVVVSIGTQLGEITNTTHPLVPKDLSSSANTLETVVDVAEVAEDMFGQSQIVEIAECTTSVLDNLLHKRHDVSFERMMEQPERSSVSEQVLLTTERVGILATRSLDSNSNTTVGMTMKRPNIIISALLPHEDDLNTMDSVTFPDLDEISSDLPIPTIEIPMAAVQHRFSVEGRRVPIVNVVSLNLESRLSADEGVSTTSVVVSSQVSDTPRNKVDFGGERIRLTINLETFNITQLGFSPRCAFWDFTRDNDSGGFSEEGITSEINGTVLQCFSDHLTSFAVLVDTTGASANSNSQALSVVTYIGCGVSIVCLSLSITFLILFRKKIFAGVRHFAHANLSVALLLGLIIFIGGVEHASQSKGACLSVAVLLHYFFLAAFCWMLCEGLLLFIVLRFVFYKGFFKSWKFFSLLGWGLPIPVVAISVGISHKQYGNDDRCWISEKKGAIWAFIGPMLLIMMINALILITTTYQVFKTKHSSMSTDRATMVDSVRASLKAAVFLLPILGLTWIFGLLAINQETIAFAWIFTILNSLQGVFIFFFYVFKNPKFLAMFSKYIKRRKDGSSSYYNSNNRTGTPRTSVNPNAT